MKCFTALSSLPLHASSHPRLCLALGCPPMAASSKWYNSFFLSPSQHLPPHHTQLPIPIMCSHIPQFSCCFSQIFNSILIIPFLVAILGHMAHCNWIINLYSFHNIHFDFFLRFWYWIPAEGTCWFLLFFSLT